MFILRETIKLLDTTRMILDTALLSSLDKQRMSAGLKEALNYEIEIKTGSIDNLTITLVGTLFKLDTKTRKGKLDTGNSNTVNVQVAESLDIHAFSDAAYDKGVVEFSARPLMSILNGVSSINGYELISFDPSKQAELNLQNKE